MANLEKHHHFDLVTSLSFLREQMIETHGGKIPGYIQRIHASTNKTVRWATIGTWSLLYNDIEQDENEVSNRNNS